MSKAGIERAAKALADLQTARHELMAMATAAGVDTTGLQSQQDILLSHLMDKAKDAIKDEFIRLTDIHNLREAGYGKGNH